jgi:hypothetical protein
MSMLFTGARLHVTGPDGDPLAGGWVYTYAAGTTTPKAAYNDHNLTSPKSNPFQLDAYGESTVWLDGIYKINIEDSAHVQIPGYPVDNVSTSGTAADSIFIQAGTGAIPRSAQDKMREWVSVLDFAGVDPTGVLDSTAGMNLAHATGKVIRYPEGTYKFTRLANIVSGGIVGCGRIATILQSTDTTSADLIPFADSATNPIFRDFSLISPQSANLPVKTGGAGISLQPVSGEISYAHFDNVTFGFQPTCVNAAAAAYWTMTNCEFLGYNVAGVRVANTYNNDSGDSSIQGCLFNTPGILGAGVLQNSSGGLKIIGNKFLGGANGIFLSFDGTTDTSDLIIVGNSIEHMAVQGIALTRASGVRGFANVVICSNQFLNTTSIQTDASGFLNELVIQGNVFNFLSGAGYGINLTAVRDFSIGGNTFKGNGGTPAAIITNASCSNGKIGVNAYAMGLGSSVTNSSTTVFVDKEAQQGTTTTSAAGWVGYGALFASGTTTVTFPTPFTSALTIYDIALTPTSTNGACGAIVTGVTTSGSTYTGFTYTALSSVNSVAASYAWKAWGVI